MSFVVMTDTSSNLPSSMIRERDIKEIAFPYYIKGRTYQCTDTGSFDGESFYAAIRQHGVEVTTSQITPQRYMDFYEPWLKEGKDILYVSMSSGISGSCSSSQIGAKEILQHYPERRIEIVDSLGASLGEGLLALQAADLRDNKIPLESASDELREAARRMCNVFTVDDLMYLKRGGRLSNLSAALGMVLNIKPILKGNEEGKIVAFAKVRGRKQSISTLAQLYEKMVVAPENQIVGIAQAACREDAETLAAMLRESRPPKDILIEDYEPVTGSHVGPGALALFFSSYRNIRSYNGESLPTVMRQVLTRAGEKIQKLKDK
ncbi:MAG: DegV family protein [Lachnospiraceae bacterium]|nr:DegV family protein [Lachnospiraceae bacterium]